jgi:hypothetical protein
MAETQKMKLCYVDERSMWFTALPLDKQWGDDWDDAPYEHNAGTPYDNREGPSHLCEVHFIDQVVHNTEIATPREGEINSRYSVEQINAGVIPWLRALRYNDQAPVWNYEYIPDRVLMAGVSIEEAIDFVFDNGGFAWRASSIDPRLSIVTEVCRWAKIPAPYVDPIVENFNPGSQ